MPKNGNAARERFAALKSLFRSAPLPPADLAELRDLAARFDPRMRRWMDENPELC